MPKTLKPCKGSAVSPPFQGCNEFRPQPQGSRLLEPWAEISQRLQRFSNCITAPEIKHAFDME